MKTIKLPILFSRINRLQKKFLDEKMKHTGLIGAQYLIVFKLYGRTKMTPKEITELGIIEKAAIAKILKKLEEMNYIQKNISSKDKRSYSVSLTKLGETIALEINNNIHLLNKSYQNILNDNTVEKLSQIILFLEQ
ncbi:MAG: MarR family winged helix-turn-helix transcriptional regulator [Fusobacteriaceae bacterium]